METQTEHRKDARVAESFRRLCDRAQRASVADYCTAFDMLEKIIGEAKAIRRQLKKHKRGGSDETA
jgi:hypothetical protein